jgi:hypothetical protein
MKLLLMLPLVLPFACLALLSVIALLSIAAIGATLGMIRMVSSAFSIAHRQDGDPRRMAPQ